MYTTVSHYLKNQKLFGLFATLFFLTTSSANAQLVVNEISQGPAASKEYIELTVMGNSTCTVNTADIRKWIVDDNNGWLGTGPTANISTGCIRFADHANWANVPYGSLILLYDDADKNTSITLPDDPTDANHDGVYVLPVSSTLLESNITTPAAPSASNYTYPATGFTAGGNWSLISLENSGDGVILVAPSNPGAAKYSFGYGSLSNTTYSTVYKSATGAQMVYCLMASQFASSASWTADPLLNQTPGAGNTTANTNWINSLKAPYAPQNQTTNVGGCGSYTYMGITYTATTFIKDTIKGISGCDSVYRRTNIIVQNAPAVLQTTSFSACRSVVYNGVTYTASTNVKDTLKTIYGCDSVYRTTQIKIQDIAPVINTIFLFDCNEVIYNNVTYTSSAAFKDTVRSTLAGCDSILTTVNIRIPARPVIDSSVIRGCGSVVYNGTTYTDSVIIKDTLTTMQGCDSVYRTRNLIIRKVVPVAKTDSLFGCNTLTFIGIVYTAPATVLDTIRTAEFCDSIYRTTNITIQVITPVTVDTTAFGCKEVIYKGITYNNSTTVNETLKTILGCDSVYKVVHITIRNLAPVVKTINLTGCNNVVSNGQTYNASVIIRDTVRTSEGCDTIYNVTNIVIKVTPTVQSNTFISCTSVFFNGRNYFASTIIRDTVRTSGGCDSIYKITNIDIQNNPVTQTTTLYGCNSLVHNGITYTNTTTLKDTLKSQPYCDSVYRVTIINIKNVTPVTRPNSIIGCNSVVFNGITYTSSAVVKDTVKTIEGCDSIFRTNTITIQHVTPVSQAANLSGCNSLVFNSITYTASTVITDTVKALGGCDSIYRTTNINITVPVTQNNTLRGCSGSIVYNGIAYTSSTIVSETLKSVSGCDSIYRKTTITVQNITPVTRTTTLSGCGSVVYNGVTYTSATTLTDTLKTSAGCDSIYNVANINIVLTPSVQSSTVNGCGQVLFQGITYTSSAVKSDTLKSAGGCDSVYIVTNINVQNITPTATSVNHIGCAGSVTFNGVIYTASATIRDTTKSSIGCDSVYTLHNIIVANITPVTRTNTITDCNSIIFNGTTYTVSTSVTTTIKSIGGCDSIYNITNLVLITPASQTATLNGCNSLVFNGITYTTSSIVRDTVKAAAGCDSIYNVTTLAIRNITAVPQNITFAACNAYVHNGITYTASTVLYDTLRTAFGCDSVYKTTNIIVQHITPATVSHNLEGCSSLVFNGITYTSSTAVSDTTRSIGGCDSLYTNTNITIVVPVTQTATIKGCNSIVFNGINYTASTVVNDTIRTVGGCDSLRTITTLTIENITAVPQTRWFAGCNTYIYNGVTYSASTVLLDTVKTLFGCDSIYRTNNIVVQHITAVTVNNNLEGCSSIVFNGTTYTSSIIVRDTTKSIGGCDSIYTVTNINIVKPVTVTVALFGCNSLAFHGVTYTTSVVLHDTLKTVRGCDSVYNITNIKIQNIVAVPGTNEIKGCGSVLFNGITYTSSTTVLDTLRTTLGCDSIFRTNYIYIQNITPTTINSALQGCYNVSFNGNTYNQSTVLRDTVKSSFGCDSIYNVTTITVNHFTLNLTANPNPVIRGTSFSIQTNSTEAYSVTAWSPAAMFPLQTAKSQTAKADSTRTITVIAQSAAGCIDTATIVINVEDLDHLFIPNTFTPNGDGKNDQFKVYGNNIKALDMKLFNQWGQLIFESSDVNKGWDGRAKGENQPIGVYIYAMKITMNDGSVINKRGSLNLVR